MKHSFINGTIAEFERHYGTIAMFPFRNDIWRDNAIYMQNYIIELITIIAKYEPVFLFCAPFLADKIDVVPSNVTVVIAEYDDIWARDISPTFVRNNGEIECLNWKFNSWGGKKEGAYYPWDADNVFPIIVSDYFNLKCKNVEIVLEGGAFISDGSGTLFTTRSVLLNRNRNPFKSKEYIEREILKATNDKRIIWIDQGLANDETNGHIDNLLSFVNRNELCLSWTDNKKDPNYKRLKKAFEILSNEKNLDGDAYKIHLIPLPPTQYMTECEANGLKQHPDALLRKAGDILPASYLNYYIINGAVIIPSFGCSADTYVKNLFKDIFPKKEVIQIYSREPLLGGGGIHCLLHEIPLLEGS